MKSWLLLYLILCFFSVKAQVQIDSFQDLLVYADTHAIAIQSDVTQSKSGNGVCLYILKLFNI